MLGLDVLGNPVNVVRGVVEGTVDLFYEPIKVCVCVCVCVCVHCITLYYPHLFCVYSSVCVCVYFCVFLMIVFFGFRAVFWDHRSLLKALELEFGVLWEDHLVHTHTHTRTHARTHACTHTHHSN